ncbi:tetratricopeptide repeat protein [Amycolatopsis suaedae]|uniref:Tetratricopeptide repeat protein n=1 Tax=Amycolatopsis suaedae TaxID=2510978 RepID=A0A4Q7J4D4_9PSEU|nr:tetratricopeptide repeat protein [Amycolatopsis suaedae]
MSPPRRATFQLLGPVQLFADDKPVPVGGPGVRGLLALLALHANKVLPLDDIIDGLWGHDPPATARTIVHGNVSHLRRVLRSIQGDDEQGAQIHTRPPGYQLSVDPLQIDVHRAHLLLEQSATARPERRANLLAEAFALWKGPALGGVPDSITAPELDDLRLAVHAARVDAELELGRHAELISELTTMVRENPLAERTIGQLMRALYHAGRRADALEVYRRASRHVVSALGIDPGPELRELHDRILRDELGGPPAAPQPRPRSDTNRQAPSQLPPAVPALAGRDTELAWLDDLAARAEHGASMVGLLTGAAGVGKSTLAVSWAHRRAARFPDGVLFAALRGFDPEHPPLDPADVLTQFLLGLGVPAAELPETAHARVAMYRSLLADARVLVVLDDARAASQVQPLLPPGPGSVAVVTSRARLDGLVVSSAARVCALDTLPSRDAVRLIEELAGPSEHNSRLAELCGHLPLALRIAGARLAASPRWTAEDLVAELTDEHTRLAALDVDGVDRAGTSVRAAFDVSYRGLPPDVAALLPGLGVLTGQAFEPHVVAAAHGIRPEHARRGLRILATHHLVTETARDVFTPHDLVRLYLRDLAAAELSAQARESVFDAVVRYHQTAADRARRRLLRIVDPLDFTGRDGADVPATPAVDSIDAALDWFDAEWPNLMATLEAARAAGRDEQTWQLARVMHTYRVVRPLRDDWTRLVEIGLAAAVDADSDLGRCWMLISRCGVALTFGVPEGGLADAQAAVDIAERLGDPRLVTSTHIHLGAAQSATARYEDAIRTLRAVIAETERTDDLALRGQALNNCAEAEKQLGHFTEAIELQVGALEIDRKLGDDSYAVVSLNNLAELSLGVGELDEARRYAEDAIELATTRAFTLQEGVARRVLARILTEQGDVDGAREQLALSVERHEQADSQLVEELSAELEALAQLGEDAV